MDFLNNAILAPVYYAGLFDGEGSVSIYLIRNQQTYPRILAKITNSFHPVLMYPINKFGGYVENNKASQLKPEWADIFTWKVYSDNAIDFLKWIQPYSIVKRDQIDLTIEFWTIYQPKRKQLDQSIVDQYMANLKSLKRGK